MELPSKKYPNYSRYSIFSNGDIINDSTARKKKATINKEGYYKVGLSSDDKTRRSFSVHRLVAELFVDNYENKPTVNHMDGDKSNNDYSNLEWATRSEQVKHAWDNNLIKDLEGRKRAIRAQEGKKVICITTGETYTSLGEAAEVKGLKKSNISAVCHGKVGYKSAGVSHTGDKLVWRFL